MDLTVETVRTVGTPGSTGRGDVVIAWLAGDLDLAVEDEFSTRAGAFRLGTAPRVIFDLTAVTFLDARGIAALVEVAHQVHHHGGRLALVAASTTRRLLHLAELDQVITVKDTLAEAITSTAADAGYPRLACD